MSSTLGKQHQIPEGQYSTPREVGLEICKMVSRRLGFKPDNILEPGCGQGHFMDAARTVWPSTLVFGVEKDKDLAQQAKEAGHFVRAADMFETRLPLANWDLIIGNPAFELTERFVRHLLPYLTERGMIWFLQRGKWVSASKRFKDIAVNGIPIPSNEIILTRAPSFAPKRHTTGPLKGELVRTKTGKLSWGGDSCDYSMFGWNKNNPSGLWTTTRLDLTGVEMTNRHSGVWE